MAPKAKKPLTPSEAHAKFVEKEDLKGLMDDAKLAINDKIEKEYHHRGKTPNVLLPFVLSTTKKEKLVSFYRKHQWELHIVDSRDNGTRIQIKAIR